MGKKQKGRDRLAANLSKNLRRARSALGLTQAQVAEQIETSFEFYSRCERGTALPSLATLVIMARKLQVSLDTLVGMEL